jgi:hypothetical protein
MSDETPSTSDFAAIDLAKSFLPSWAQESEQAKPDMRFSGREYRDEPPEHRGGRRDRRDARPDRSDRRPPRRDGGRPGPRSGPRRDDDRKPERAPQLPDPVTGWEIQFLPDKHGVDGVAKQIRTTAKAYPLFDLAHLVLDKSPRYNVEFKRVSEDATPLFQLKADGTLWLTEREAVSRALAAQLDKFYRRERIAVDPPKGIFPCVAVCGMSGTLLGPPNYHDYQSKLIRLHAERFANMPFEAFKNRIRMERGEEAIAKWREEQSTREVFYPIDLSKPAPEPAPAEPVAPEPAAAEAEPIESIEEAVPSDVQETESLPAETEPVAEVSEPAVEAEANEEPPAPSEEVAAPAETGPRFENLADVESHFREHHLAKAITRIRERIVVPGPAALNESAPSVLRLTRGMWEQLSRFPLPLAHRLAQLLSSRGVQIFKSRDNITYAGVARPHFLDRSATPIAEGLAAILAYLEANPKTPRGEQWKALLALRPVPAEGADTRETSLAADLLWLLHQGHVVDFAKRNLEVAHKPKPPTPKAAKKTAPAAKPAAEIAQPPAPAPDEATPEPAAEIPAEQSLEAIPEVSAEPAPEVIESRDSDTPAS